MAAVRIGPKHQVTIPKEVFEALKLDEGDFLEPRRRAVALSSRPCSLQPRPRHRA